MREEVPGETGTQKARAPDSLFSPFLASYHSFSSEVFIEPTSVRSLLCAQPSPGASAHVLPRNAPHGGAASTTRGLPAQAGASPGSSQRARRGRGKRDRSNRVPVLHGHQVSPDMGPGGWRERVQGESPRFRPEC